MSGSVSFWTAIFRPPRPPCRGHGAALLKPANELPEDRDAGSAEDEWKAAMRLALFCLRHPDKAQSLMKPLTTGDDKRMTVPDDAFVCDYARQRRIVGKLGNALERLPDPGRRRLVF